MKVKGKYWLNIYNLQMGNLNNFDTSLDIPFTSQINKGEDPGTFASLRFENSSGSWYVTYYHQDPNLSPIYSVGGVSALAPFYSYHYTSRLIDFGPEEITFTPQSDYAEQAFNLLYTPMPDDEYVDDCALAYASNSLLNAMLSDARSYANQYKPTLSTLLNNSSGTTSLSTSIKDYDILFVRANTYSTYTPLCYAIPTKAICAAVGTSGSFPIQIADNSKYSVYTGRPTGLTYASGNNGKLFQVYGLRIPEVT